MLPIPTSGPEDRATYSRPLRTTPRSANSSRTRSKIGVRPRPRYHLGSTPRGSCPDVVKSPAQIRKRIPRITGNFRQDILFHRLSPSTNIQISSKDKHFSPSSALTPDVKKDKMPPKRTRAQGTGETSNTESTAQGSENPTLTAVQIAELSNAIVGVVTTGFECLPPSCDGLTGPDDHGPMISWLIDRGVSGNQAGPSGSSVGRSPHP
ncbi:hypothetical protein F511_37832 [Dorcoceras hygrometricum]|uniref:Uncharacterized protein n=1 Tax=Dorcoceras hygrometricum TaxID=472368 RepID=A0A2Z7CJ93_9LAMI|nr:hypothetical protein F511_37832 [Dorcoceras hygrometricum]